MQFQITLIITISDEMADAHADLQESLFPNDIFRFDLNTPNTNDFSYD